MGWVWGCRGRDSLDFEKHAEICENEYMMEIVIETIRIENGLSNVHLHIRKFHQLT